MIVYILAQSEIWYIWPETNVFTVLQVFIFILLFILILLVGRLVFIQKKTVNSSWTHILNYAYNKKLSSKEIAVLEHFFNSLSLSTREKSNLLTDKKGFQSYLYTYFKKYHSESVESYVRILDKLFPMDNNLEIKSLLDIHVGEICSVDFEDIFFLAKVINKTHREILLSINDNALKKEKEGGIVNLYFYRNNLGGFLIPGIVKKVTLNGLLFFQEGEIQTKGEEHLVADVTRDVQIFPWGLNGQDSSISLHDNENPVSEPETIAEDGLEIPQESDSLKSLKGTMIKLSDRALLLNIQDPFFNDAVLRKIDIWEIALNLSPGMTPVVLKGKILKSNLYSESYIFKFIAPSESDIKLIFEEIKKHMPVRGFIS